MPIETPASTLPVLALASLWLAFEVGIFILSILYFIFSLIVIRQVALMTEALITEVSPFLRALSIIHAGLALGVVVYLFWTFFR